MDIEHMVTATIWVLLIVAFLIGAKLIDWNRCHTKAEMQGYECSWGPIQGCMVKIDGKWVDYDKWRVME